MGTQLFISMLVSTIGAGYFIYGKKQSEIAFMICGILLCVYTYFISGTEVVLLLGALLMYAPFGMARFFGF